MKALVTGGGGFLGRYLVRRLIDEHAQVRVLGRGQYPLLRDWGVSCLQGDVRDPEDAAKAVEGVDTVFHVAARVGYWGPFEEFRSINVEGTKTILEAALHAGVSRFVFTSSPSVVIGPEGNLQGADERTPFPARYLSHYGPTKAEAERRVLAASSERMRTVALRPHFIFGPGDPQIAPRLAARAREGRLVQVGDGTNQVDVAYIDNVVDAHILAAEALTALDSVAAGQAYFIGNAKPVRLWEFVARMLEGLGEPPVRRVVPLRVAFGIGWALEGVYRLLPSDHEPPLTRMGAVILGTSHFFSHEKAKRDLGWRPRVSTEEGLDRFFQAARAPA